MRWRLHCSLEFKIEMQDMDEYHGYLYPDAIDRIEEKVSHNDGSVKVSRDIFSGQNNASLPGQDFSIIS